MEKFYKTTKFKKFHLVFWLIAGIGLFISGYFQSDALVSLTRNAYLAFIGAGLTFLLLSRWPKIKNEKARRSWLLFLVTAYILGTLITIPINPVTYAQLGLDFDNITWRHITAGTMNFSMVLVFWGFCLILMFDTGFKFPGTQRGPLLPVDKKKLPGGLEIEGKKGAFILPLKDISHLKAAADYVEVILSDGTVHLKRATIQSLAARLERAGFLQVHRSIIINTAAVQGHEGASKGSYTLVMATGERLKTSRRYQTEIQAVLG